MTRIMYVVSVYGFLKTIIPSSFCLPVPVGLHWMMETQNGKIENPSHSMEGPHHSVTCSMN